MYTALFVGMVRSSFFSISAPVLPVAFMTILDCFNGYFRLTTYLTDGYHTQLPQSSENY